MGQINLLCFRWGGLVWSPGRERLAMSPSRERLPLSPGQGRPTMSPGWERVVLSAGLNRRLSVEIRSMMVQISSLLA